MEGLLSVKLTCLVWDIPESTHTLEQNHSKIQSSIAEAISDFNQALSSNDYIRLHV